jgi:hypothetical protein
LRDLSRSARGWARGDEIGIEQFRAPAEQRLDRMLTQPFRGDDTTYALDRRDPVQ